MVETTYTYLAIDFENATRININELHSIIKDSLGTILSISRSYDSNENIIDAYIIFSDVLSTPDKTILDGIIHAYVYHTLSDIIAIIKDIKIVGTNGGDFVSGSWQTRTLNTVQGNQIFARLIGDDRFTLDPGNYHIQARVPGCNVFNHQSRLYNITDSSITELGSCGFSNQGIVTYSEIMTTVKLDELKTFKIQHICANTVVNIGYGKATGFDSDEIYTSIVITQI